MHIEPTTPPRSARLIRARGGAFVALAALAGAALLSACGSSSSSSSTTKTNLDTAKIAVSIEQSILKQRHIHATVSCPTPIPQEVGKTFTCVARSTSTVNGKSTTVTTPFTVTVQSTKGYVTYHS